MFEKRKDFTLEAIIDSMTFLIIGSKLADLSLVGSDFAPFLWTRVMFADFLAESRWPKEKDRLNRADRGRARMAEQDLRTRMLMPSRTHRRSSVKTRRNFLYLLG